MNNTIICPTCDTCNSYLNVVYMITIFMSLLLAISEILAWSNCEWNSITQFFAACTCKGQKERKEIVILSVY